MPYRTLSNETLILTLADAQVRKFEKVSFEQYAKDRGSNIVPEFHDEISALEYLRIKIPQRATAKSGGYDFCSPFDFTLEPGKTIKIPTGIKAYMPNDEVLKIYIRSSIGFKYDVVLSNNVGLIDADYVDNENNEGHIWIKLINHGEKTLEIKQGEAIAQGIFEKYYIVNDDKPVKTERTGGIGSTNA